LRLPGAEIAEAIRGKGAANIAIKIFFVNKLARCAKKPISNALYNLT